MRGPSRGGWRLAAASGLRRTGLHRVCGGGCRGCRGWIPSMRSGRSLRSCASGAGTGADLGAAGELGEGFADDGVAGSSRSGSAEDEPSGSSVGRSFRLWTASWARPSSSALRFPGEEPLGADFGEGDIGNFIARSLNDFDAALVARGLELRFHPMGLPQSELRTAGCDDEHDYSCRWKAFRMAAMAGAPSGLPAWVRSSEMGPWATLLMMPRVRASSASS